MLGVPRSATQKEIKKAYYQACPSGDTHAAGGDTPAAGAGRQAPGLCPGRGAVAALCCTAEIKPCFGISVFGPLERRGGGGKAQHRGLRISSKGGFACAVI